MAKIKTLKQGGEILYPRTSTKAVLDDSGNTVESRLTALESSSGAVEVDTTLSVAGKAADAKATGDKVQEVAQSVATLNTSVTNMDTRVTALENSGGGGGGGSADYSKGVVLRVGEATGNICFVQLEVPNEVTLTYSEDYGYTGTFANTPDRTFPLTNSLPMYPLFDTDGNLYNPDGLYVDTNDDANAFVIHAEFVTKPPVDTLTYVYMGLGILGVTLAQ